MCAPIPHSPTVDIPTHPCPMRLPQSECVAQREQRPSYKELEALMRGVDWSMSSKPLGERLQYEAAFLRKSLDSNSSQQPPQ